MKKYHYVRIKKDGTRANGGNIDADDIGTAMEIIGAKVKAKGQYIISDSCSPPIEMEKVTLEVLQQIAKSAENKKKTKLLLSKPAKIVLEYFLSEQIEIDPESKNDLEEFGLLEDTDKPYYSFCYWGGGHNGSFVDESGIKGMMADNIRQGYDDNYSFTLFDVKKKCEVRAEVEEIKIKIV